MTCEQCSSPLRREDLVQDGRRWRCPVCRVLLTRRTFCRLGPNVRVKG